MKVNKKHLGSSLKNHIKDQNKNPKFRYYFEKENEKYIISKMLKTAREKSGLSQRGLARRSGVPQPAIARIESNNSKSIPGIELLIKLFEALGFKIYFGLKKIRKAA